MINESAEHWPPVMEQWELDEILEEMDWEKD